MVCLSKNKAKLTHSISLMVCTVIFAILLPISGCATYSAKDIHGQVVDDATGVPLDGVVIVAKWLLERSMVGDNNALLKAMETVTDKGGSYTFPAWGPVTLPARADFRAGRDPKVVYFKIGYWPESEQNELLNDIRHRSTPLGEFRSNGKTIRLKKWDGKGEEYWSQLDVLANRMPSFYGVNWKNFPRMTWAIEQENRRYKASGNHFFGIHVDGFMFENLSNEDREFLRRYGE